MKDPFKVFTSLFIVALVIIVLLLGWRVDVLDSRQNELIGCIGVLQNAVLTLQQREGRANQFMMDRFGSHWLRYNIALDSLEWVQVEEERE